MASINTNDYVLGRFSQSYQDNTGSKSANKSPGTANSSAKPLSGYKKWAKNRSVMFVFKTLFKVVMAPFYGSSFCGLVLFNLGAEAIAGVSGFWASLLVSVPYYIGGTAFFVSPYYFMAYYFAKTQYGGFYNLIMAWLRMEDLKQTIRIKKELANSLEYKANLHNVILKQFKDPKIIEKLKSNKLTDSDVDSIVNDIVKASLVLGGLNAVK